MGFATILSLLGFFIALVALWLTSDIVKKVENQNEKFVRAHIAAIREEMREMDKTLHKAARTVKQQEDVQAGMDKRLNEHTTSIDNLSQRLAKLNEQVDLLDRSIPQRYRVRVRKEDEKPAPKPSIQ